MPDTRQQIWLEPETKKKFEKRKVELDKTQDSFINYLIDFERFIRKADNELYEKARWNLN